MYIQQEIAANRSAILTAMDANGRNCSVAAMGIQASPPGANEASIIIVMFMYINRIFIICVSVIYTYVYTNACHTDVNNTTPKCTTWMFETPH